MILHYFVLVVGMITRMILSYGKKSYRIPALQYWTLAPLFLGGAIQSWVILGAREAERGVVEGHITSILLILLGIAGNLHLRSAAWVLFGLCLNAIVIIFNGGFMPMILDDFHWIYPDVKMAEGSRVLGTKIAVMRIENIALPFLRDMIRVSILSQKAVMSIGDIFAIVGMLYYLGFEKRRTND